MAEGARLASTARLLGLLTIVVGSCACASPQTVDRARQSHACNPIGWPAKLFDTAGEAGAGSGWPIVREVGRALNAIGELGESPALWVESIVTLDPSRALGGTECLVVGTGRTVTATWNLPFFWVPGRNIDLARDADFVNEALALLEEAPLELWRADSSDPRTEIFPKGTRCQPTATGHLIYTVPGYGEVLQVAESNRLWDFLQWTVGTNFPAQERSWGFIVRNREQWDSIGRRQRAVTILHELYHQHPQMRNVFRGWTTAYWPAYLATFPFTGWSGHWAEMHGEISAGVVDRALSPWVWRRFGEERSPAARPASETGAPLP